MGQKINDPTKYAIKLPIKLNSPSKKFSDQEIIEEGETLKSLQSTMTAPEKENIIEFFYYCTDGLYFSRHGKKREQHPLLPYIVEEFAENGKLYDYFYYLPEIEPGILAKLYFRQLINGIALIIGFYLARIEVNSFQEICSQRFKNGKSAFG